MYTYSCHVFCPVNCGYFLQTMDKGQKCRSYVMVWTYRLANVDFKRANETLVHIP